MKKKIIILALGLLLLVMALPEIIYLKFILSIPEKPTVPINISITEEESLKLWQKYEKNDHVAIDKVGPYDVLYFFLQDKNNKSFFSGHSIISLIAMEHNRKYFAHQRMLYWHLSNLSLMVWISSNWSEKEVLLKAKEIEEKNRGKKEESVRDHP